MRKPRHGHENPVCTDACCLKLEGLSVRLQGNSILENVAFHLHCGEIVALIGPNGAGKSSLLRSILGQIPYTGTITFAPAGGKAVVLSTGEQAEPARALVGYVPQSPTFGVGEAVSVLDFFTAATASWPVWLPVPKKHRLRAEECLARVHGADLLDKSMGSLSGGELQRVLLALALEPVPHILILDEPFSGVDVKGTDQLMVMLDELRNAYDLSIFLSTHDFATLPDFADRVILLDKQVRLAGTPQQVLSSAEFYETFQLRRPKGGAG